MIYILLDIFNYKQLIKINPELEIRLQACYHKLISDFQCLLLKQWETQALFSLAIPQDQKPTELIKCLVYLKKFLNEQAEELFGYNLLIHEFRDTKIESIQRTLLSKLFLIEDEKGIWCDEETILLLKENLSFEKHARLYKIIDIIDNTSAADAITSKNTAVWYRESVLKLILNELIPSENVQANGLLILSAEGFGTEQALNEAVKRTMSEKWTAPLTLQALSPGYPAGFPFIQSIDTKLLPVLPSYLTQEEQSVWQTRLQVLDYFKSDATESKCFDHFLIDAYLFFSLYLSAYIRMMEEKYLPTFLFCLDLEKQPAPFIKALKMMLIDFLNRPSFIPVLIAREQETVQKLKDLNLKRIDIPPLSLKEIKILAASLYPGLNLGRSILKKLNELTSGKVAPLFHYLWYLENEGAIKFKNEAYNWVSREEKILSLTKNVKVISWSILKKLADIQKEVLYTIYLANGLLGKEDLIHFFTQYNFEENTVRDGMKLLMHCGFINDQDPPRYQVSFLIKKLERSLKPRDRILYNELLEFIKSKWRTDKLAANVPLYYFFIRHGCFEAACELLPSIIENKLDENDFSGVLPFLDIEKQKLDLCKDEEIKKAFTAIITNGQLRYTLLNKKPEEAGPLPAELEKKLLYVKSVKESALILLNIATYYLYLSNNKEAVKKLKEALLKIQDSGLTDVEARIYTTMACLAMVEGRIEEALDYSNIVERLCTRNSLERVRCLAIKSISNFILGKISRLHALLEDGIRIAGHIGHRQWELFFYFLKGRLYFTLGEYGKAAGFFLTGLNIIELYKIKAASALFYIWLARSHIYNDNIEAGTAILKSYPACKEALYYLAEGYYFTGKQGPALDCLEKALTHTRKSDWFSPESLDWNSSYGLVEGYCLPPEKKDFIIQRHIRIFRAYLYAQSDNKQTEFNEFQQLTASYNLPGSDMYSSYYNLLYYLALPKYRHKNQDIADRLTVLNKALALLQEQTNRLDFHLDKTLFLKNNYWNRKLVIEAKANNLL